MSGLLATLLTGQPSTVSAGASGLKPGSAGAANSQSSKTSGRSELAANSRSAGRAAAKSDIEDDGKQRPLRVLLVGNSYTLFNLFPTLLQRMADAPGAPKLHVDVEARGGYSLRMHLKHGTALSRIKHGNYDYVVLQGHSLSAVEHADELIADAQRFHQAITASGARTILYQTWARRPNASIYRRHRAVRSFDEMASLVDVTYSNLARELGAGLAPIGGAFEQALRRDPLVPLWGSDGSHPTLAGSYMAACVLYGAITGSDPRLSDFVPWTLDERMAEHIRAVAAMTLGSPGMLKGIDTPRSAPAVAAKTPITVPTAPSAPRPNVAASIASMLGTPPGMEPAPVAATHDVKHDDSSAPKAKPASGRARARNGKVPAGRSPDGIYDELMPFDARARSEVGVGSI